jgi:F-box protein 18 (helicase)
MYEPTKQQQAIIDSRIELGQILKIEAGAGTGKTETLIGFSKARPQSRILYLCFNAKASEDGRGRFQKQNVRNVTCKTIHGLAAGVKDKYKHKFNKNLAIKDIERLTGCSMLGAKKIKHALKKFCESADPTITERHIPRISTKCKEDEDTILTLTKETWNAIKELNSPFPISFDHYLKIYQLENPELHYDYILLDEAQDSNPITLAILDAQRHQTRTIIIGDENQAIYQWRGARNALRDWPANKTLPLTESFRFGKQIQHCANILTKTFTSGKRHISGLRETDSVGKLPLDSSYTLIARTNATLLETAYLEMRTGKKIHFINTKEEENWDPTNHYDFGAALDVYKLWKSSDQRFASLRNEIKDTQIKNYENYDELKRYVDSSTDPNAKKEDALEDVELLKLCKLVEKYKDELPFMVSEIARHCTAPHLADRQFTTTHRSKGLEFLRVKLASDFPALVIHRKPDEPEDVPEIRLVTVNNQEQVGELNEEEINLFYVAVTRAKERLELNSQFEELIDNQKLLLGHIKHFPTITPSHSYIPTPEPTPPPKEEIPHSFKFDFEKKDAAKEIARKHGGRLEWKSEQKLWAWVHPRKNLPPDELIAFAGLTIEDKKEKKNGWSINFQTKSWLER